MTDIRKAAEEAVEANAVIRPYLVSLRGKPLSDKNGVRVDIEPVLALLDASDRALTVALEAGESGWRGMESAAEWHVAQIEGGHCGEAVGEIAIRQRKNRWHEESAAAIRKAGEATQA